MNSKERLLAVLKGKKPDRIPWTPLIDGYFLSSLKEKNIEMNSIELLRHIRADILERHVSTYIDILQTGSSYMIYINPKNIIVQKNIKITTNFNKKSGEIFNIYETPLGIIKEKYVFTKASPFLPFPVEHKIKKKEDLSIYKYLLTNIQPVPSFSNFQKVVDYIGDDGLATASGPPTPLLRLLEKDMGVEDFYYFLYDYPKEMEEILDIMHERNKNIYRIIIKSPAEVIIDYENSSTTLFSPQIYKNYCLNQINEYTDIVHEAGKIFLTHMCGKLDNIMDLISEGKQDGIADVAPPPTGDLNISKALKVWGRNKIVIGGIDATAFTQLSVDDIKEYVKDLLEQINPADNFILGSGDATPYGTPLENLKAVTEVVENW
jgi:uroporphyrinogen-III decarboxylase